VIRPRRLESAVETKTLTDVQVEQLEGADRGAEQACNPGITLCIFVAGQCGVGRARGDLPHHNPAGAAA
jgi:hypothetical protein